MRQLRLRPVRWYCETLENAGKQIWKSSRCATSLLYCPGIKSQASGSRAATKHSVHREPHVGSEPTTASVRREGVCGCGCGSEESELGRQPHQHLSNDMHAYRTISLNRVRLTTSVGCPRGVSLAAPPVVTWPVW